MSGCAAAIGILTLRWKQTSEIRLRQWIRAGGLARISWGQRLLCLAAGGGRPSVLFASAGAKVTVVDISPKMLGLDRQVAWERNLNIQVVEGSMDDLSMFPEASFDIVIRIPAPRATLCHRS